MRGEQLLAVVRQTFVVGSPPLARGTVRTCERVHHKIGITPACAGNSIGMHNPCDTAQDHPRLRGEQISHPPHSTARAGSPPLARGTEIIQITNGAMKGITPACAGNSLATRLTTSAAKDHPRLRGEQAHAKRPDRRGEGSPPLARGTDIPDACNPGTRGITPACAGNSQS